MRSTGPDLLLERDAEIAGLRALVTDIAGGSGRTVLVEGEAGIGKTCLLATAAQLGATAELRVFSARARPLERTFPYGVVSQLLEAPVHQLAVERREVVLGGAAAAAASLLGLPSAQPPPDSAAAAAHALYWLVSNLADSEPLLLIVDDLHWADEPSLRALAYLAYRLDELSVGVLGAARPGEPGPHGPVLAELALDANTTVVRPAPLSSDGVRLWLDAAGGQAEDAFVDGCRRRTGGNPFLVSELVAAITAKGIAPLGASLVELDRLRPERIEQEVGQRLASMPQDVANVACVGALLGAAATLDRVAQLAGVHPDRAVAAADLLAQMRILRRGFPIDFAHPLVRAAVTASIPAARLDQLHREAARALTADGRNDHLHRVAGHLLETTPAGEAWAADALAAAAQDATDRGDPADARTYLRRALAEPPDAARRADLHHQLGRAELALGDPAAVDSLLAAQRLSSDQIAQVAIDLTAAFLKTGRVPEALATLRSALAVEAPDDRDARLRLEGELIAMSLVGLAHLGEMAGRAAALADELDGSTSTERLVLASSAVVLAVTGHPLETCADVAQRALAGGVPTDSPSFYLALDVLMDAERYDAVRTALDAALAAAQRHSSVVGFVEAQAFRAYLDWFAGALPEAAAAATDALEAAYEAGHGDAHAAAWLGPTPMAVAALSDALIERGDLDAAQGLYTRERLDGELAEDLLTNFVLFARGRLRLACDRLDDALADFAELDRRDTEAGRVGVPFLWRSAAALALAARGQRDRAVELARTELERAAVGGRRPRGVALCALGVALGGNEGVDVLTDSVDTLAASPARLEHARALIELGAALRRRNRRNDAVGALRQGLDAAARSGALVLAERALEELRACGVQPRRALLSGVEALTPSERRVALLARDGLGNVEIAQRLFVTRKTVEAHLGRAYSKLGIRSRVDLPAAIPEDALRHV